ncbi:MAG: molybdopterin-binding/glycosyltransferase family 2 protein [Pseudomonadota bacterium]
MKFGSVSVQQASGGILAHSLGLPSRRLKKGRVLSDQDLADIAAAGFSHVTIAQPEAEDVLEDAAAARVAAALVQDDPSAENILIGAAFTGRANLFATIDGVLQIDVDAVMELNAIDEAITLATLPNYSRVTARQMLGTIKVIPYGADEASVVQIEEKTQEPVLRVHPFAAKSVHLVLTQTPGMKQQLLTKGAEAVRQRLAALGIKSVKETIADHTVPALVEAMRNVDADLLLVLTGSATSDRGDVGPAALIAAGGRLTRFGMPVDPGNLLFLGEVKGTPVIGLPGCARSPKLNGADWVLERLAAGLDVQSEDIAHMGVGGLLKEIPSRPQPRAGGSVAPTRPRIAAVLLAAGASSRMRGQDKLLQDIDGAPLLRILAERLMSSGVDDVHCVLPQANESRAEALRDLDLHIVMNARAREGMGTSIATGVAALDVDIDAVLIVLGDMPELSIRDIDRMLAPFDPAESRAIVRAVGSDGRPGHPVLFGRRFFEALQGLDGDAGARKVVAEHPEFVVDVTLEGEHALIDLDTPEDWAAWRSARSG